MSAADGIEPASSEALVDDVGRSIEDYLAGGDEADVSELEEADFALATFTALKSMVGERPLDFKVRLAALKCFIHEPRPYIPGGELRNLWHWMNDAAYTTTMNNLSRGGWIHHDAIQGWHLTDTGHRYYQVLLFLAKQSTDSGLEDSLHMMDALNDMELGEDASLHSIKSQLKQVLINVQQASKVFSSILLERQEEEARKAIEIANQVVKRADKHVHDPSKRGFIQDLHKTLSDLGVAAAHLQRNRLQVLEQGISLPSGFTLNDVTRCLMDLSPEQLASPIGKALRPAYVPTIHIDTKAVMEGGIEFLGQERLLELEDLPEATEAEELDVKQNAGGEDVRRFLRKLRELPEDESEWTLADIVDSEQGQVTLFNISLATMVGTNKGNYRRGTIMRQFADLPFEFIPGFDVIRVEGTTLKQVSNAVIRRRNGH